MVDLEKALKGLEMCTSEKGCDSDCPYWNNSMVRGDCLMAMQKDALGLLKEMNTVAYALTVLRANGWKEDHTYPEIVRCKDCRHVCKRMATEMFPDMPVYAICTLTDEVHDPEWYCADGERS